MHNTYTVFHTHTHLERAVEVVHLGHRLVGNEGAFTRASLPHDHHTRVSHVGPLQESESRFLVGRTICKV